MSDPTTEGAKAIQEIAKATGKGIDAAREAGGFIAKYIHGPLEQAVGIWIDKLKYTRWENQQALMQRANSKLAELGLSEPTRPIPLKLAIPLLQEGSMEDDGYLQDCWANLLVNAANIDSGIDVRPMFISMMRDMTSLDIMNLSAIFAVQLPNDTVDAYVWPGDLPTSARRMNTENDKADVAIQNMSPDVHLSLHNLTRLGCITTGLLYSSQFDMGCLIPTALGRAFVDACTLQKPTTPAKSSNV